jgi:hypothetical protein
MALNVKQAGLGGGEDCYPDGGEDDSFADARAAAQERGEPAAHWSKVFGVLDAALMAGEV